MPQKSFFEVAEDLESLQRAHRYEQLKNQALRLKFLILLKQNKLQTQLHAAEVLQVAPKTIGSWVRAYRHGGLQELLRDKPSGPQSGQRVLDQEVYEQMSQILQSEQGFESYKHVWRWANERNSTPVKYPTIYRMIRRDFGGKLKVARPSHTKKKKTSGPSSKKS